VTTLQDEQVITKVSQNPTIVYERRNNKEGNPNQNKKKDKEKHKKEELPTSYIPKAPFPAALEANTSFSFTKKGIRMDEMMELFKQVQINLPLLDTIKQVSSYAKFLKDLCTQKRRLRTQVPTKVLFTQQVSAVLMDKLSPKLKDPGAPIISYVIGDLTIERVLLDLGASVNVLPSSVYDRFSLRELKPTPVTLQFVDRSVKVPRGLIEDVLVKVKEFYFPVDFIVLDMESTHNPAQIPIILGCPFLATSNACINYRIGMMDISFGSKKIKLNIFNASQEPSKRDDCFDIDLIEEMWKKAPFIFAKDPLQSCLTHFDINEFDCDSYTREVNTLLHSPKSSILLP